MGHGSCGSAFRVNGVEESNIFVAMPGVSLFSCLLIFLTSLASTAEPVPAPADQRDFTDSINGCAPATILNLLKFSAPEYAAAYHGLLGADDGVKMRYVVDRYFRNRPSVAYPGQKRWGLHGIESNDLATGLNELLAESGIENLNAAYLDREEGEDEAGHLLRGRQLMAESIRQGVMPILSLRSFVVKHREENQNEPVWEAGIHHYVLIKALRGESSEVGFDLEVIDPWRGKETVVHVHREAHGQAFRALRGVEETGVWLDGKPFLQVLAHDLPSLRPQNLEWSERFVVVANFLVGRF